ncbi:uncharacterized protein I206_101448 [Kwoniella pini CBS 10737]|uniref:Glycosyltransferase family 31 protein n=1 Tax=Kwoniella pini CBS 10737 TaxID=1296096 RepID=A0A1B9HWM0_9TREE|nr:uncharacterized protein I206_06580 [Kwoniella pini CBS 10737]OCF47675.1 hypothetical protein I206_06580 [Kwoniella pini CBS 10737]
MVNNYNNSNSIIEHTSKSNIFNSNSNDDKQINNHKDDKNNLIISPINEITITTIPPSPSPCPTRNRIITPQPIVQPSSIGSTNSLTSNSRSRSRSRSNPHIFGSKHSTIGDRNYFPLSSSSSSSTTTPIPTPHIHSSPNKNHKHLRPIAITRSQSHYINRHTIKDHPQEKNGNIPSIKDKSHNNPLKRLSIDDTFHNNYNNAVTTGSDVHTPTQEYGSHSGIITRRRPSISTPTSNTYTSPRSRQTSLLRSPPSVPASSSSLGWLTGNRLTLPPINNKHSTSDDEREEDEDNEEEEENSKTLRTNKKWDWRMASNGLPKYGESSTSGSASGSSSTTNTPFISMTPPSAYDVKSMPPPLPIVNSYNTSPPRTSILPSQAPLASPSNLQPLPQDPYNILPLSVPSSPLISPCVSRAPTPHQSPHPSLQDLASEYAASANVQSSSSRTESSPRTSISTSSSRYGWGTGRSDSRSSEEDDLIPPFSPITTSTSHRPVISFPRSGWWQRSLISSKGDTPVSPKINLSNNNGNPSRIIRFPVSANKFVPTGTRNWGWLFEVIPGFASSTTTTIASTDSSIIRKNDSRKNSITTKTRNRERERLMSGHSRGRSDVHGPFTSRRKSINQKVLGSKWLARVMVFVPTEPWSISLFLIFFAAFAVTLTFTIKHILNPDKEPLPWRQYCTSDYPTLYSLQDPSLPSPHVNSMVNSNPSFPSTEHIESVPVNSFAPSSSKPLTLMPLTPEHPAWPYHPHDKPPFSPEMSTKELDESLNPVGVLIGVFTTDAGVERRHMIRQSYASHWRSRRDGTEGIRIRFVMGRPRKRFEKAVQLEMEAFNDILLLDMDENMNSGKTHAFFSWAAENATVPSWEYPQPEPIASDTDTESNSVDARQGRLSPIWKGEKKPDYVVKADEDSFIMLGELEKRLRVSPRSKAFWGYLVKNTFMAGECYALSFDLVQYIHASPALRTLTRGKEDKLVAKWMNMHPEREQIVWVTERCWIYDHPKAGTVYSHGFLFPSIVNEVRTENLTGLSPSTLSLRGGAEAAKSYSSVSKFGVAYRPISTEMTVPEQVEALIEGSPLSLLKDTSLNSDSSVQQQQQQQQQTFSKIENIQTQVNKIYSNRPTRKERFLNDENELGGTVVVHYIKKNEWFQETMIALLGGASNLDDQVWHKGVSTGLGALEKRKGRVIRNGKGNDNSIEPGKFIDHNDRDEKEEEGEGVKLRKGDGL